MPIDASFCSFTVHMAAFSQLKLLHVTIEVDILDSSTFSLTLLIRPSSAATSRRQKYAILTKRP